MAKVDIPLVDVVRLKPLPGFKLWILFSTGEEGVRDLSSLVASTGPMIAPLKDPGYFARVFVEMGAPAWPNGFDLDPINLYLELKASGSLRTTSLVI